MYSVAKVDYTGPALKWTLLSAYNIMKQNVEIIDLFIKTLKK